MKNIKNILFLIFLGAQFFLSPNLYAENIVIGEKLPSWKEGVFDIHNINTGCGNATFCVFPDGTTMLIDAGADNPNNDRHVPVVPNSTKTPGEWIVHYIQNNYPRAGQVFLDYVFLTHFHKDHIGGGVMITKNSTEKYYLTGITEVLEHIPTHKIIDRGYPDYDFFPPQNQSFFDNYLNFVQEQSVLYPDLFEEFIVGSAEQFILQYDKLNRYIDFDVRNMVGNGKIWSGKDKEIIHVYPENAVALNAALWPLENSLSCGVRISYGKFTYFNAGDLLGYPKKGKPSWHELETTLAPILGKMDVANVGHHGYWDATNEVWLQHVSPQVMIIQASDAAHPTKASLSRITNEKLYSPIADIFTTNLYHAAREEIGDLIEYLKSVQGHIVVRVAKDCNSFQIIIIEDQDDSYKVKAMFGPYVAGFTH